MIIVAVIVTAAWFSYVMVDLWAWFVVPLGVPEVSWDQMVGLNLLWGCFSVTLPKKHPQLFTDDWVGIAMVQVTGAVVWGVGWLLK